MYICIECGNVSQVDYKCCDLCGNDEWEKDLSEPEKEVVRVKFHKISKQ